MHFGTVAVKRGHMVQTCILVVIKGIERQVWRFSSLCRSQDTVSLQHWTKLKNTLFLPDRYTAALAYVAYQDSLFLVIMQTIKAVSLLKEKAYQTGQ